MFGYSQQGHLPVELALMPNWLFEALGHLGLIVSILAAEETQ